jgi:hypothetical protein
VSAWDDPIGRIRDLEAEVATLREQQLRPGLFVHLDCDNHDPKRAYRVVRVDGDGAWLTRADPGCPCDFCQHDTGPFCLATSAAHAVVTESQGVLL